MIDALHTIQATLVEAENKAKSLPTDSPTAFERGAEEIGRSVDSELSGFGDRLGVMQSAELSQAADADPSCQQLKSL